MAKAKRTTVLARMTPLDPLPVLLQPWQNFYLLTGTAAATLTGLMFVAVTFGARLVTKESVSTARAFLDPTLMHFVQVLFTGCLVTVPVLRSVILGAALIGIGGFRVATLYLVFRGYRHAQRTNGDVELSDWIVAIVLPLLFHLLLLASGVGVVLHQAAALTGLAIVTGGLLLVGIYGAWELLVWMAGRVTEQKNGADGSARGGAE
jgi:hypothetical protein